MEPWTIAWGLPWGKPLDMYLLAVAVALVVLNAALFGWALWSGRNNLDVEVRSRSERI